MSPGNWQHLNHLSAFNPPLVEPAQAHCIPANISSTISGGTISGNQAVEGGGVCVSVATLILSGNTVISGNTVVNPDPSGQSNGGGVSVQANGVLTMDGGAIRGNTAGNNGGGVYASGASATFTMNGGAISGNHGNYGGGVSAMSSAVFTMTDGAITDNTATTTGGAISAFVGSSPDFTYVTTSANAVFSGNSAARAYDYGIANKGDYPNLDWQGENSIPGTHLLNNYDAQYVPNAGDPDDGVITPHTVTFLDHDGTEIAKRFALDGDSVTPPGNAEARRHI